MSYAAKQLKSISEQADVVTVEFQKDWSNGTGYFDHLVKVKFPQLKNGDRFKTVDTFGRLIVGVVTPFGNVVCFKRYSDAESNVVVNNAPAQLREVVRQTSMSEDAILSALGFFKFDKNIGKVLDLTMKLGSGEVQLTSEEVEEF